MGYRRNFDKTNWVLKVLVNWHPLGQPWANDWQCKDMKVWLPCFHLAGNLRHNVHCQFPAGSGGSWTICESSSLLRVFPSLSWFLCSLYQFLQEALPWWIICLWVLLSSHGLLLMDKQVEIGGVIRSGQVGSYCETLGKRSQRPVLGQWPCDEGRKRKGEIFQKQID